MRAIRIWREMKGPLHVIQAELAQEKALCGIFDSGLHNVNIIARIISLAEQKLV